MGSSEAPGYPPLRLASLWAEAPLYDLTISLSHCSITTLSVNPLMLISTVDNPSADVIIALRQGGASVAIVVPSGAHTLPSNLFPMTHGGGCGLTDSFILNTEDSIAPFDLEHGDGGVLLILLA